MRAKNEKVKKKKTYEAWEPNKWHNIINHRTLACLYPVPWPLFQYMLAVCLSL